MDMVPVVVHRIGNWLDQFTETLSCWERMLCDLRSAYFRQDMSQVAKLSESVESAKMLMLASKSDREEILANAQEHGLCASNLRELSKLLDSHWPALWTHRLLVLENQIARIQQLGVSLWIHSAESRDLVSELMRLLGAKSPGLERGSEGLCEIRADQPEPLIITFSRKAA